MMHLNSGSESYYKPLKIVVFILFVYYQECNTICFCDIEN